MSIENQLHEEIRSEIEGLKDLELGTEKHEKAVNSLVKLLDKSIEIDRVNIEHETKEQEIEIERYFKQREMTEARKDRIVRYVLTSVEIAAPIGLAVWGTAVSINFEKTGTFSTLIGRAYANKLLPRK